MPAASSSTSGRSASRMESGMGRFVFVPGSTNTWRMAPSAAGCPSTAASIRVLTGRSVERYASALAATARSVRRPAYLRERMFPQFQTRARDALATALDRAVEFATLGEYRYAVVDPEVATGTPAELRHARRAAATPLRGCAAPRPG